MFSIRNLNFHSIRSSSHRMLSGSSRRITRNYPRSIWNNRKHVLPILYSYWSCNSLRCFSTPNLNLTEDFNHEEPQFESVIGLEVHAQLQTNSKLFSSANAEFIARPNSQVAYFDQSLPGTLPVLNQRCVELAIRTGLALHCHIPLKSSFDRKHYFYGDMPNGYQITQQREPIAKDGFLDFIVYDEHNFKNLTNGSTSVHHPQPYLKRCHLKQIQLEQDSGKSLADTELNQNLIDLNRAGTPLIEFVFEPDLRSPLEAISLIRELIQILLAIEACSCKMEEGALRIDANVSIRPSKDQTTLGTRTEIKNLNSLRHMREAIKYEISRQSQLASQDTKISNETLGFDNRSKKTFVMRDKEIVQDYRFMPEPNLPPILLTRGDDANSGLLNIKEIDNSLQRHLLPESIRNEFQHIDSLGLGQLYFLQNNKILREIFSEIFSESQRKHKASEIVDFLLQFVTIGEESTGFVPELDRLPKLAQVFERIGSKWLAELIDLRLDRRISPKTSIDLIKFYLQHPKESEKSQRVLINKSPTKLVDEFNWWLIDDLEKIELVCRNVIEMLPKIAKNFAKNGKRKKHSLLIQKAMVAMDNSVTEEVLWKVYDKLLRNKELE